MTIVRFFSGVGGAFDGIRVRVVGWIRDAIGWVESESESELLPE